MEVTYTLNGKNFKDYGVFVSASKGLVDTLPRRAPKAFQWAEYHGDSVDLTKPRFGAREIELQCFIVAENWSALLANFNALIRDEFAKPGTQRLVCIPFVTAPLVYQVYQVGEVSVDKRFTGGEMIATFTLKLIEPNPVKKILNHPGGTLTLSYKSPSQTEIYYPDGTVDTVFKNASLSKKLPPGYVVIAGNIEEMSDFSSSAPAVLDMRGHGIFEL